MSQQTLLIMSAILVLTAMLCRSFNRYNFNNPDNFIILLFSILTFRRFLMSFLNKASAVMPLLHTRILLLLQTLISDFTVTRDRIVDKNVLTIINIFCGLIDD